jgi:hypothetical protein
VLQGTKRQAKKAPIHLNSHQHKGKKKEGTKMVENCMMNFCAAKNKELVYARFFRILHMAIPKLHMVGIYMSNDSSRFGLFVRIKRMILLQ